MVVKALKVISLSFPKGLRGQGVGTILRGGLKHLCLLLGAFLMAFPFYWMVITSFKPLEEALRLPPTLWPQQWLPSNYTEVWLRTPMARYLLNSVVIAGGTTVGVLFSSALAAHSFTRMRFPGRSLLFAIFLATMMIPFEVLLIPDFVIIRELGWYNTYWALIIPWTANVFAIFLLRQTFMTIPDELWEAALLDGCGHWSFLRRIALPLARPALLTIGIVAFLGSWNALLWPLVVTDTPEMRPIQVGLASFISEAGTEYNLMMAAASVSIAPIILMFLLAQRYFVEGLARTGMKT